MYGCGGREHGDVTLSLGTGAFIAMNTSHSPHASMHGMKLCSGTIYNETLQVSTRSLAGVCPIKRIFSSPKGTRMTQRRQSTGRSMLALSTRWTVAHKALSTLCPMLMCVSPPLDFSYTALLSVALCARVQRLTGTL